MTFQAATIGADCAAAPASRQRVYRPLRPGRAMRHARRRSRLAIAPQNDM